MRSITITLSDELTTELRRIAESRDPEPTIEQLVVEILEQHVLLTGILGDREFRMPLKPLTITPVDHGDGPSDVSANHDAYFADDEFASWNRNPPDSKRLFTPLPEIDECGEPDAGINHDKHLADAALARRRRPT